MTDWETRAEALEVVDAVRWNGTGVCQFWSGLHADNPEPEPCEEDADALLILDSDLEPRPMNALACTSCKNSFERSSSVEVREPGTDRARTDGGRDLLVLRRTIRGPDDETEIDGGDT